jgi:lipopolysaccharide export system protein LptA
VVAAGFLIACAAGIPHAGAEAQAAVSQPKALTAPPASDPFLGSLSFTSSNEPVEVTSKSLEFDYRARVLTYRGDVVAKQGDVQLSADTLTIDLSKGEAPELKTVVAEGRVRFTKGTRRATAEHAVYDQSKRLIVLSRNAVLSDERGDVSGDSVHVYLDESRTVIEGGEGRVRAVLRPSSDDAGAGGDPQAKGPGAQ